MGFIQENNYGFFLVGRKFLCKHCWCPKDMGSRISVAYTGRIESPLPLERSPHHSLDIRDLNQKNKD